MTKKKRVIAALVLGLSVWGGGGLIACRRETRSTAPRAGTLVYHCPMHPSYVSDRPGQCPICKMDLVPIETPAPAATDVPGPPVGETSVAGRSVVALSSERRQLLGVRSEPVRRRPLERVIRTVGRVAIDERRIHHVHTKYEAYVERLYVNFVGQSVRKSEPLAALYSPELVATQQEFLLAHRAQQQLAASGVPSVAKSGADLVAAARQRLLFWDMAARDIERLERTGTIRRTVDLYADRPGYVIGKTAVQGMRVTAADTLFDIADLSSVWILADVYEADLPNVRVGMSAIVTLPYEPARQWSSSVTYVNPLVDPGTRTVKVRIDAPNPSTELKPDMFTDVLLRRDLGNALFVPESAVLRPGERSIVFLDRDGRLEPREVTLGDRVEGGYALLAGLSEGDPVVTSANFLIDSESSLKAALSAMSASSPPPAQAVSGHVHGAGARPDPGRLPDSTVPTHTPAATSAAPTPALHQH